MEIEQGTPVLSSSIDYDLLSDIDLPDLRLPRAFNVWTDFRVKYNQKIENIGILQPEEVAFLAGELSSSIGQAIGIELEDGQTKGISKERVAQLTNVVSGKGNRIIFMRHGEQSPPEWIFSIPNPAVRKIRMMQNPFNKEDLLTNRGLVDVFVSGFILLYIQEVTGKAVHILSSENRRAKEPAEIISTVISDSTFSTIEGLTCITYRDEKDQPPTAIEDLLVDIPQGTMPWYPELVDKWCKETKSGKKQSEVIIHTIEELVKMGTDEEGNSLFVVFTHNQQLAEVLRQVGRLQNPSIRFPELTMLTMTSPSELLILRRGILIEETVEQHKRNSSIRRLLETVGGSYEWYRVRRAEYDHGQKIPFLIGPEPLYLSPQEGQEVVRIGRDVVDFMHAADELYRSESDVKELLDRGKPKILQQARQAKYLFVRPDLLITKQGFSICEIETSPFGLALAELLNRAYRTAGFNTMVEEGSLSEFLVDNTPPQGIIVYSHRASSFAGQLQFLANEILSGGNREWRAESADSVIGKNDTNIYRAFYQYEYLNDLFVNKLVQTLLESGEDTVVPSFTPHMEEKALLSLIWDRRWEQFFRRQLGVSTFEHLREVIPPTWVIGQEQFSVLDFPGAVLSLEELANLPKSRRGFVLKKSGFGEGSSWGEEVNFLQEKSGARAKELLARAQKADTSLYIVQEFRSSVERPMIYENDKHILEQMKARVRLTPYFSMVGGSEGQLVAIKATGCEGTNYIHASTGSINTAVALA